MTFNGFCPMTHTDSGSMSDRIKIGVLYSLSGVTSAVEPTPRHATMLAQFGSCVSMIGSDYVCPYESNRVMSDLILERGGEKVDETYMSLDAPWESYLDAVKRIKRLAPDFIFSTVVGEGIAHLYRAFAHVVLDPYRTPIASHMTSEAEIAVMGNDLAQGHITSAAYFQSVDTAANLSAVAPHQAPF